MNIEKEIGWLLKEKYDNKPTKEFQKDIERLKEGAPLAYIIGFVNFLGCKIDVSKKPLIPRTETEFWLEKVMAQITSSELPVTSYKVLDIFAGSGCIGISIMRYVPNAKVTFAEKDKNLLGQIKLNCKINSIDKKRYKIKQADIFGGVTGKFDYIFANPPYIPATKKGKLQKSVIKYEPSMALFGKEDGLFYIQKFLAKAKGFLNPAGKIFMEFDSPQKKAIEKLLVQYKYRSFEFHKDQYGRYRYVVVQ